MATSAQCTSALWSVPSQLKPPFSSGSPTRTHYRRRRLPISGRHQKPKQLEARSMKGLLRRVSRVAAADACAAAGAYQPLRADAAVKASGAASPCSSLHGARRLGGRGARVPEGHVPVCVGEEGGPVERFAVRAELLGQPAFAALLRRAAQEYGYGHPGALRIPCPVTDFRRLLSAGGQVGGA